MEKSAPGGENSQAGAAERLCAVCSLEPPETGRTPMANQQRAAAAASRKNNIAILGDRILMGEPRFSTLEKFRRLSRTPPATLPPFPVGEESMQGCSALPHTLA